MIKKQISRFFLTNLALCISWNEKKNKKKNRWIIINKSGNFEIKLQPLQTKPL